MHKRGLNYVAVSALAALMVFLSPAHASNVLKSVQVRQDGSQMLLKAEFKDALKAPPIAWTIIDPPRIVLDFPETENHAGAAPISSVAGELRGINLVQSESRTRMVLNLYRPIRHSIDVQGNLLFVKLETIGTSIASSTLRGTSSDPHTSIAAPSGAQLESDLASVRDLVFRRGDEGQALILLELTSSSVPVDVRRTATGLTVDIADTELPQRLQNKRDVTDFATPVTSITSRSQKNSVRIEVAAKGKWFHQAQLANNQLTIEVKPVPVDDANKLVQSGQQGQKVSINFFDADATMILRTLADISGKNVMIDPSLAGRRVTVALDNIPYDQALDIVMGQVNAGMRIRSDVVLFGDRTVLQQRDQAAADEAARANDTAPLVSETFTLSYIKPTELAALIRANIADTPGGVSVAAPPASGAPAVSGAQGPNRATQGGGMLSVRGSMSPHDPTKKLFIRDTGAVIDAIREIVRNVDVPQKQVMIEARIVEAGTGFNNSLGLRLRAFTNEGQSGNPIPGTTYRWAPGVTSGLGGNLDMFGAPGSPTLSRSTQQLFAPTFSNFGTTMAGLLLFNREGTKLLTLELAASESDSKSKTVSSPRIVTMDRKAATINNTQQVTVLTGVNAQTGLPIYQTFAAPLNLTVTPSINPDNRISLELSIAKSSITDQRTGSLTANTVTTSVIVDNGGTVVIGGFSREEENVGSERVPFLGDLPYVGFLFKTTSRVQSKAELLVFITPRIVGESLVAR